MLHGTGDQARTLSLWLGSQKQTLRSVDKVFWRIHSGTRAIKSEGNRNCAGETLNNSVIKQKVSAEAPGGPAAGVALSILSQMEAKLEVFCIPQGVVIEWGWSHRADITLGKAVPSLERIKL